MRFENRIVAVTGASRGIGRAIAQAFAREGAHVACIATTEANAMGTADLIARSGGRASAYGLDVSDAAAVAKAFGDIAGEIGEISVLVNNAGITKDALLLRMKDEDWDAVMDVNLKGAYLCTKAAIRSMMKLKYGRIVNIGSVIGQGGGAGQASYAASKAGLIGLTKSVAKELGGRGVTCNAVAPGFIETDMTHGLSEEMRLKVSERAPVGRLGSPEDIAPAVLFLASAEAAYITGQVLVVDGGLTL